ncbi:MAG: histidine kinase [Clostridiales bacterium]|nr:histidine kinase [Clostridiales bacterium]
MKMKYLHSRPIFVQLVIFSLLISLIPIGIVGTYLFRRLENMVVEEMVDYHSQIVSQYTKNIEEKLDQYQESLQFIANNTVILNTLTEKDGNAYINGGIISEEVAKSLLLEKQSEIRNCMIYSQLEENPVYGRCASMFSEARLESWYQEDFPGRDGWFTYQTSEDKQPILSLVKTIEQADVNRFRVDKMGFVKMDVKMNRLFAPAPQGNGKDTAYDVIIYEENRGILYATDIQKEKVLWKYLEQNKGKLEGKGETEGPRELEAYVINQAELENVGLKMLFLFDNQELLKRKMEIKNLVFPLILVVILLVVGCSYLYSRDFSSRIEVLVGKFKAAETGDLAIRMPIEGNDEVAVLDQKFNHMLVRLDQLIKTNYIQQMENKEAQLRNLQLQINPHFLYNTLETISSIAAVKQAFVVCDMCQRLGDIFRYSLGKDYGEFVTLEQELSHTQNYIFIQKIRHGNRFEAFYSVEVDVTRYRVLRFILQPIVENAILHGLGELTGTGTLEISIYEEDEMLMIRITDDGVGMGKEKVEELNEYINSEKRNDDSKKSIGIRNVNQRIKLSCGERYGVTIESLPYQGSCFTLRLPMIEGGEGNET